MPCAARDVGGTTMLASRSCQLPPRCLLWIHYTTERRTTNNSGVTNSVSVSP